MFSLPLFQSSVHGRTGIAQWLAEFVATLGLLLVILGHRKAQDAPWMIAAWIGAAYWFTSSTSFANPAVTIARALSNTFAGISPSHVPAFILAQLVPLQRSLLPTRSLLHISKNSTLRQRHARAIAHDDVVEQTDVHQSQCLFHPLCDELVRLRRFCHAARVIVRDDHGGGIALQGELHDLPRMHAGAVNRAAKQLFELNQAMPLIQVQATKYLVLQIAQPRSEKISGCSRAR